MREWEKWGKCQKYQTTNFVKDRSTTGGWKIPKILNNQLWQSLRWKSDALRLLGVFGRKRSFSEEEREDFWWKKGVRWVGLAY